jgi:hypothetical protein
VGDAGWDEVRVACLERQVQELQRVVRWHEDYLDTYLMTPAWKRWLFIADGWSGHRVVDAPAWRPWRRWWRS